MLSRKERSAASANPEDRRYFSAGVQVAELTNNGNNDADRIDWNQAIATHGWTPNSAATPFRWNTATGVTAAQLGAGGYDPLNATGQGMSGTDARITVRSGDTLASLAAAQWVAVRTAGRGHAIACPRRSQSRAAFLHQPDLPNPRRSGPRTETPRSAASDAREVVLV